MAPEAAAGARILPIEPQLNLRRPAMYRWMCVLGLGAALSGACGTTVNVEQERTALMQRDRDWSAAANETEKFLSFLTADASVYPSGAARLTGTEAIRKMHAGMTAVPGTSISWTPATATVSAGGDVGHTTGTYELKSPDGVEKGKYITLWRKENGQWMATDDMFSPDGPPASKHALVTPDAIKFGDPPPGLPAGARLAVVSGNPAQAGPFVLRVQVPAGYRVPPHWHATAENLTILNGTVAVGMGEKWDDAAMRTVAAGGFVTMPAEMRHYFLARTAATFQLHGNGPFAITYVNAADDPRKK
jgi:ketosteroid isomerase-like protein/quercetin dioxygenase-like cupin family protein